MSHKKNRYITLRQAQGTNSQITLRQATLPFDKLRVKIDRLLRLCSAQVAENYQIIKLSNESNKSNKF